MVPTATIEDVSENCFLFGVIKFKSGGSLAELLRFQSCRLQIDRQIDRQLQLQRPLHYTTTTTTNANRLYTLRDATLH